MLLAITLGSKDGKSCSVAETNQRVWPYKKNDEGVEGSGWQERCKEKTE